MTISVSCENCGKQFRNIHAKLAGKKARCTCGTIVRLGTAESSDVSPFVSIPAVRVEPVTFSDSDLLSIDLIKDGVSSQVLLRNDFGDLDGSESKPASASASRVHSPSQPSSTAQQSAPRRQEKQREEIQRKRKALKVSKKRTVSKERKAPAEPKSSKRTLAVPKPTLTPKPVNLQPARLSETTDRPSEDRRVFAESYSDLDAILDGAGDASPMVATPRPSPSREKGLTRNENRQTDRSGVRESSNVGHSTIGFLSAIGSATLGFWFGTFVVATRFHRFTMIGLDRFSHSLQSAYFADFGDSGISSFQSLTFVTLGWALWGVGIALILVAILQLVNAFFQWVLGKQWMSWADGLAATAGVAAVFLIVALVFTQSSFRQGQELALQEFERPSLAVGDHLPQADWARQENNESSHAFTLTMLVGAAFPMTLFVLSAVRLFVTPPHPRHATR